MAAFIIEGVWAESYFWRVLLVRSKYPLFGRPVAFHSLNVAYATLLLVALRVFRLSLSWVDKRAHASDAVVP
jgi:hypothetical protein